jgi:hypothetical protein
MASTKRINTKRVLISGLLAGVIIFIVTGIVNGGILSSQLESWMHEAGSLLHSPGQTVAMSLWSLMCLIYGLVGMWIYAGIRPRYGAGPKTALLAGLALWVVSKLAMALDLFALGIMPTEIIAGQLIGGFVALLLGIFVGARFYKE